MASTNRTKKAAVVVSPYTIAESYDVVRNGIAGKLEVVSKATPIALPAETALQNSAGVDTHICQVVGCGKIFWGKTVTTFCAPCWKLVQYGRQATGFVPVRSAANTSATQSKIALLEAKIAEMEAAAKAASPKAPSKRQRKLATKAAAAVTPAVATSETTSEVA